MTLTPGAISARILMSERLVVSTSASMFRSASGAIPGLEVVLVMLISKVAAPAASETG